MCLKRFQVCPCVSLSCLPREAKFFHSHFVENLNWFILSKRATYVFPTQVTHRELLCHLVLEDKANDTSETSTNSDD